MLVEIPSTSPLLLAGSRRRRRHRAARVLNAEVPSVRYFIGLDREEYDYINRVIYASAYGLQEYVDTLPSCSYASPRLDLGCFVGNFLIFMLRSPSLPN